MLLGVGIVSTTNSVNPSQSHFTTLTITCDVVNHSLAGGTIGIVNISMQIITKSWYKVFIVFFNTCKFWCTYNAYKGPGDSLS